MGRVKHTETSEMTENDTVEYATNLYALMRFS
jgi:hypothetical protein